MQINDKVRSICDSFDKSDNILVAFSGGVDSSFLLYILKKYSPASVSAVTIKTPYIPEWEIDEAIDFADSLGVVHEIVEMPISESIINNPGDRCYRCKSVLFSEIKNLARRKGYNYVLDGSNADDTRDYRPGMKALDELKVQSPLLHSGFTKQEIRQQLREFGLKIWEKPAYACLLTRIPYNTEIKIDDLKLIEDSEFYLHNMGFPEARVRLHKNMVRLEINPDNFSIFIDENTRNRIISFFKEKNIEFISLDLEGYRMGSMNTKK